MLLIVNPSCLEGVQSTSWNEDCWNAHAWISSTTRVPWAFSLTNSLPPPPLLLLPPFWLPPLSLPSPPGLPPLGVYVIFCTMFDASYIEAIMRFVSTSVIEYSVESGCMKFHSLLKSPLKSHLSIIRKEDTS